MEFFWKLTALSFKQELTYRAAMIAGLATNLFFGLMRAMLLIALYNGRGEMNQLTLAASITYVGLSQSALAFVRAFGSTDLMQTVHSGSVGADLLKPANLFSLWMAKDFGRSILNFLGRGALFMLLFGLFYRLSLPDNAGQWLLFFLSLMLGWLVSFAWRFLVNLASFWTPDAQGVARWAFTISTLCAGFVLPLRLLPDWFNRLCSYTPFPAIINTPNEIFLGTLQGAGALRALGFQALWFVLLALLCQVGLAAGIRRLVIQGG